MHALPSQIHRNSLDGGGRNDPQSCRRRRRSHRLSLPWSLAPSGSSPASSPAPSSSTRCGARRSESFRRGLHDEKSDPNNRSFASSSAASGGAAVKPSPGPCYMTDAQQAAYIARLRAPIPRPPAPHIPSASTSTSTSTSRRHRHSLMALSSHPVVLPLDGLSGPAAVTPARFRQSLDQSRPGLRSNNINSNPLTARHSAIVPAQAQPRPASVFAGRPIANPQLSASRIRHSIDTPSSRAALEDSLSDEERHIFAAAQSEAAELVWKHRNPNAPYAYKSTGTTGTGPAAKKMYQVQMPPELPKPRTEVSRFSTDRPQSSRRNWAFGQLRKLSLSRPGSSGSNESSATYQRSTPAGSDCSGSTRVPSVDSTSKAPLDTVPSPTTEEDSCKNQLDISQNKPKVPSPSAAVLIRKSAPPKSASQPPHSPSLAPPLAPVSAAPQKRTVSGALARGADFLRNISGSYRKEKNESGSDGAAKSAAVENAHAGSGATDGPKKFPIQLRRNPFVRARLSRTADPDVPRPATSSALTNTPAETSPPDTEAGLFRRRSLLRRRDELSSATTSIVPAEPPVIPIPDGISRSPSRMSIRSQLAPASMAMKPVVRVTPVEDTPLPAPSTELIPEIRSDDIRAATSKLLKDRSANLPTPAFVSDAADRPIVSFQSAWAPPVKELHPLPRPEEVKTVERPKTPAQIEPTESVVMLSPVAESVVGPIDDEVRPAVGTSPKPAIEAVKADEKIEGTAEQHGKAVGMVDDKENNKDDKPAVDPTTPPATEIVRPGSVMAMSPWARLSVRRESTQRSARASLAFINRPVSIRSNSPFNRYDGPDPTEPSARGIPSIFRHSRTPSSPPSSRAAADADSARPSIDSFAGPGSRGSRSSHSLPTRRGSLAPAGPREPGTFKLVPSAVGSVRGRVSQLDAAAAVAGPVSSRPTSSYVSPTYSCPLAGIEGVLPSAISIARPVTSAGYSSVSGSSFSTPVLPPPRPASRHTSPSRGSVSSIFADRRGFGSLHVPSPRSSARSTARVPAVSIFN